MFEAVAGAAYNIIVDIGRHQKGILRHQMLSIFLTVRLFT